MKRFNDILETVVTRLPAVTTVWYYVALMVPCIWLCLSEGYGLYVSAMSLLFSSGLYVLLLSFTRHTWKSQLFMFPVTFLSAFQLVLLNLYGNGVIAVDMFLNVATTNSSEVYELLSGLVPALLQVVALYIIPILFAVVDGVHHLTLSAVLLRRLRWAGISMLLAGGVLWAVAGVFAFSCNLVRCVFPANAIENLVVAVGRWQDMRHYSDNVAGFSYDVSPLHPDDCQETYVVVIGESSRTMNWQLAGYGRTTNPGLSGREVVYFFDKAMSESNTTHVSVPMLMSPTTSRDFSDSICKVKSFISAFEEAGFNTTFISAQRPNRSYIDFFASEADRHVFVDSLENGRFSDMALLGYLDKELIKPGGKKLIVLHCYGSHYNYRDRYSGKDARFLPDSPLESLPSCRQRLLNAYDNTVLLTDSLLSGIIDRLGKRGGLSALIYTSDHGENIFDDGRNLFLHASPRPSFYQLHVPFIVWLSPQYAGMYPGAVSALSANKGERVSSSSSFFHTILDLAGLNTKYLDSGLSLISDEYECPDLVYLNQHYEYIDLKSAFTDSTDRRLFNKWLGK